MSQSGDVKRWVRPTIEHAQNILSWWVKPEMKVEFRALFLEGPVLIQLFVLFFIISGFFCFLVMSFSQKSNCLFWVSLSTFWCFVFLCSVLKVVFKRIIYLLLSWCSSSLGTVGFLFLVMLLGCGLWCLVSFRWFVWINI